MRRWRKRRSGNGGGDGHVLALKSDSGEKWDAKIKATIVCCLFSFISYFFVCSCCCFLTHVVVLFVCYLFSLFLFHINFSIVIVNTRQIESGHRQLGGSRLVRPPTATEDGPIPTCVFLFRCLIAVLFVV